MTATQSPYFALGKVPFLTAVTTGDACQKKSNGIESQTPRLLEGSRYSEYAQTFPSPREDKDC